MDKNRMIRSLRRENRELRQDLNDARDGWESSANEVWLPENEVMRLRHENDQLRAMYLDYSSLSQQCTGLQAEESQRLKAAVTRLQLGAIKRFKTLAGALARARQKLLAADDLALAAQGVLQWQEPSDPQWQPLEKLRENLANFDQKRAQK